MEIVSKSVADISIILHNRKLVAKMSPELNLRTLYISYKCRGKVEYFYKKFIENKTQAIMTKI